MGGVRTADVSQEEAQNAAFQSSSESRVVKQTESCLFITHVICHVLQPAQMINHLILEMSSPN